ncbi:MAG TPA: DUF4982 domain-containing protein, partial [Lacipirellulaceae bacterium]|nr:DUF4982 domain-containing protein [Lacipirellulaceae bacterium]
VDDDHQRIPERIIVFSESFPKDAFECWDKFDGRPYVIGDFVWTGLDYVGEAGLGRVFAPDERARDPWVGEPQFPWHGAACGDIDLIGRRKPISHYRNILWDRGEKPYAAVVAPAPGGGHWQLPRWSLPPTIASWTWPGCEGQEVEVQVYSRHDFVRLTLNGETVGEAPTGRDQQFRATFRVPYQPGELKAVGVSEDGAMEEWSLSTVGEASQISLRPERGTLVADGQDLAFVAVEITDAEGRWRPDAAAPVEYKLTGPGEIVAVGSSDLASTQSYVANPRATYQGRSLVIIRTSKEPGVIALTASSARLAVASVEIISSVP